VILSLSLSKSFALLFQKVIALFATPHILFSSIMAIMKNSTNPIMVGSICAQNLLDLLSFIRIFVSISGFFSQRSTSESFAGRKTISLFCCSIPFTAFVVHD
jgi:hypothetical protein